MDTKHLSYILEISKTRNMTKAANSLYVSQSSLSQYVAKLEAEIGTPLFNRARGELTLTPAGEMYVEAAKSVIQIKDNLYRNITSLAESGHLRIGVTSQWGIRMLTEIIPRFKANFPNVTLEIFEDNVMPLSEMVLADKIDIAIMALNSIDEFKNQSEILREEEILMAVPAAHPYCAIHKYDIKEVHQANLNTIFSNDNFILSKKGSTIRKVADDILKANNLVPNTLCEMNNMLSVRKMVAKSVGVAFVPASIVELSPDITYFSFYPKAYRYNAIVYSKNLLQGNAEEYFISLVKDYPLFSSQTR